MPGDLNQAVYLKALPEGLEFTVTAIKPSIPDKSGWAAGWTHYKHGSITVNELGTWDYLKLPFKLRPSDDDGLLGHFKLHPNSGFWCTGTGGKINITFTIEGTTTVDGQSFTVPKTTGYISVSSSDWCKTARPDYSNVTYSVDGTAPSNISVAVRSTIAIPPDDVYLVGCIDKDNKLFGLNATTHSDVVNDVLGCMIRGIFIANSKLAGWATGKIF